MTKVILLPVLATVMLIGGTALPAHATVTDWVTVNGPGTPPNRCTVESWGETNYLGYLWGYVKTPNNSCSVIGIRVFLYRIDMGQFYWSYGSWGTGNSCGYWGCYRGVPIQDPNNNIYIGRRVWQEGFGVGQCWTDTIWSDPTIVSGVNSASACLT